MAFPTFRPARRHLAFLICVPLLAGCDQGDDSTQKVVMTKEVKDLPKWLLPTDKIEPALWLRSREVGHDVLPSDPEVDRLRRALHQAESRFFEDQRMIANRTAQTSDMLAEARQPERNVDIVTGMVDVADSSQFKKLYGEMCQHYLNLRKAGEDRTKAIAQLGVAYKVKGATPQAGRPQTETPKSESR